MANIARAHLPTLKKTASYYLLHIAVALGVAYAITGSLAMSITLSLVEPTVQAVAYFFHEKVWERLSLRRARSAAAGSGRLGPARPAAACAQSRALRTDAQASQG